MKLWMAGGRYGMSTVVRPANVAAPFSRYAHAVLVPERHRWLHVSGQVGVRPDGSLAAGAEAQLEAAFRNLLAVLDAAGMGPDDLVKLTVFLVRPEDVGVYRAVRDRSLDGREVASTLLVVAGLASPELLVEIEAVAAAPVG
jgi:enamine deaminase RidA (YjgF/YER057c/UK114 family)